MKHETKDEVIKECLSQINKHPQLLAMLCDLDLLPHQLKENSEEWHDMLSFICAYMIGFNAGQETHGHAHTNN